MATKKTLIDHSVVIIIDYKYISALMKAIETKTIDFLHY